MTTFKYCLLIVPTLIFQQSAFAENWGGQFSSELEYLDTSDDFERKGGMAEYRYQKLDEDDSENSAYFGIQSRYDRINDEGKHYQGRSVSIIGAAPLLESTHVSGHIGINELESDGRQPDKQLTRYGLQSRTTLNDKITITAKHERDLPYRQKVIATESGQIIDMKTSSLNIAAQATDRISIEGKAEYRKLNDGNSGRIQKVGINYTLSGSDPWVSVGFETGKIDFNQEDEGYWTPQNRRNYDLVLNSTIPVNEALDINTFAALGRSKDDTDDKYVTESYIATSAQYRSSENLTLRAEVQHGRSFGDDGSSETGTNLGFTFKHF